MAQGIASLKKFFFDRQKVLNAEERMARKALSKVGAFIRRRARSSIRKRKGISPPGSPPYSHTDRLRSAILFAYDPRRRSVVIGPVRAGKSGRGAAVLEGGGSQEVPGLRQGRRLNYRARPFMGPAMEAEKPKMAEQFRGMFK